MEKAVQEGIETLEVMVRPTKRNCEVRCEVGEDTAELTGTFADGDLGRIGAAFYLGICGPECEAQGRGVTRFHPDGDQSFKPRFVEVRGLFKLLLRSVARAPLPIAERSKTLDFESELEIVQVRIICNRCTFYQYHRPCTVSTVPLILLDKILAQASGP
ncbi:hypothetical protein J6590_082490 [Homalodisca vitripennis]|nr:hypothetical protein J6590_082490 [Homalodisca vitripennis]